MSDNVPELPSLGEIISIQAYMPSTDNIRDMSVLEVNTLDDINSNKLGVTDWCNSCQTCDNFLQECPGHFGHLELKIPCYRMFFIHHLIKVLSCVCYYCQSFRIPKTDPKYGWIASLEPKYRLEQSLKFAKPYKTCGKPQENTIHSKEYKTCCGRPFVNFVMEDRDACFVKAIVPLNVQDFADWKTDPSWKPVTITPQDLFDCLSLISDETKLMIGCVPDGNNGFLNDPASCMWEVLPMPSHNTRPAHTFGSLGAKKKSLNDWTKLMRYIVSARNELVKELSVPTNEIINIAWYSVNDIVSKNPSVCFETGYQEKKSRDLRKVDIKKDNQQREIGPVEAAWRSLNKQIAAFHSHKHKKFANKGSAYGKPPLGVESRYKGQKIARYRCNINARRVENAIRCVLEGDMRIRPDQVIVPMQEAMKLIFPEYVTSFNRKQVHEWIANGPYVYPGANFIVLKSGKEIDLGNFENRRDINLNDVLTVKRHLQNGDPILVNRQPTLHRNSCFGLYAIIQIIYVARLHYSLFPGLGADCDGDEIVMHVPQTYEARAEQMELCSVKNCIMKDGKIWVTFIQNAVVGAYLMTRPGIKLDKSDMCDLVSVLDDVWEFPTPDEFGEYTPHQIISLMLPKDFTMETGNVKIHNGVFKSGQLSESTLNGPHGILNHMFRDYYDKEIVIKFIYQGYLLFQKYIDHFGLSAGYYDCAIDPLDKERYANFDRAREPSTGFTSHADSYTNKMINIFAEMKNNDDNVKLLQNYSDTFPHHNPQTGSPELEENIKKHIEKINKQSSDVVNEYHKVKDRSQSNGILHFIKSGAKGSESTINVMCGKVCQVFVIYKRFGAISSHFVPRHNTLSAFGFINESYSSGISLPFMMIEGHAACESVVNKNKGTSGSGYTVRKLTTCMMGIVIDRKSRAVDTNGRVVWNCYGNDNFDPQALTKMKTIPKIAETNTNKKLKAIVDISDTELEMKHELAKLTSKCKPEIRVPFDFEHLFLRCKHIIEQENDESITDTYIIASQIDYFKFVSSFWNQLVKKKLVVEHHSVLKQMFFYYLGTEHMKSRNFGIKHLLWLFNAIRIYLERACIHPGESVGTLATQNTGEPFSQMSLKATHLSGKFRGVFSGTVRIANMVDAKFMNPTMSIVLKKRIKTYQEALMFALSILRCTLESICIGFPRYQLLENKAIFRFDIDKQKAIERMISVREIARNIAINSKLDLNHFHCSFADDETYWLEMEVEYKSPLWTGIVKVTNTKRAVIMDNHKATADVIAHNFYSNVVIHGFPEVENFVIEQNEDQRFVVTTLGSNFSKILNLPGVDARRSVCNDCIEMCSVLGIQAARKAIEYEFCNVFKGMADERHIELIARVMSNDLTVKGMKISQIAQNISMLQRASYEQGPKQMSEYCARAELDRAETICGASLANKLMNVGTGFALNLISQTPHNVSPQQEFVTQPCDYVFGFKVTGLRVMLVMSHDRAGKKLCHFYHRNGSAYSLPTGGLLPDALFAGSILDGDIVLSNSGKYVYIIHDCLLSCGNVCSTLRFDQRLELAREIVFRIGTCNLSSPLKNAPNYELFEMGCNSEYALPSLRSAVSKMIFQPGGMFFFITVKPIFDMRHLPQFNANILDFPIDGFVFTSLSLGATPFRKNPIAVFKYKKPIDCTIDVVIMTNCKYKESIVTGIDKFRIQHGSAYMCAIDDLTGSSELVVFSKITPDIKIEENSVYECSFVGNQWKIVLKRDKSANTVSTIIANIHNIIEEIPLSDFVQ
jgi:DNA-directed RNA polymerase II subunit RPB1